MMMDAVTKPAQVKILPGNWAIFQNASQQDCGF